MSLALSVVIPAHNEASRLHSGINRLLPILDGLDVSTTEVIVVDDGSSDTTGTTAAQLLAHLPHSLVVRNEVNRGKGAALKVGIAVARGRVVVECLLARDKTLGIGRGVEEPASLVVTEELDGERGKPMLMPGESKSVVVFEQIKRGCKMNIHDVFKMEYKMS